MQCQICFESYDNDTHKPFTINPCGHYFCVKCVNEFNKPQYEWPNPQIIPAKCPMCRVNIESTVINRAILDMMMINKEDVACGSSNEKVTLTSFDEISIKR
jgi:hypothetical protein